MNGCMNMCEFTEFGSTRLNLYEHGKKEVGIFELAELLGVTAEALRKYETREIIQPFRDERGYRKFHSWDLTKIICARQMRQEGFSLNDVADSLKNDDPQGQIIMIEEMQKTLMQEIQYRRDLIHWLSLKRDELMRAEQIGERCVIERQPALHCCVYMSDDTLVNKTGEAREALKQWLRSLPFSNVCYIGAPGSRALSCLVLNEDEIREYRLEHLKPDFIIPEQYYAVCYSNVEHDSQHDTSEDCFLQTWKRLNALNVKLADYLVARMIRYIQRGDWFMSVNKMCTPIAGEP